MKSHAKAATAGSTKRLGRSKPALLLCVLAASVAALALVVGSASGATTRFLVEVFGSSAQPTFPEDRGMAVDQATGELYVLETNTDEIRRYNADGTPSDFSALGTNVIDGEGAEDATPDVSLAIASSRSESQIAIDESGGATDGNIYVTESTRDQVSIFSSTGAYLGELSEHSGGAFNEPLGVAVDPSGNVYVGDFSSADLIHKYEPAANPPVNGDNSASFNSLAGTSSIGTLAAGAGATAGFIFVNRFNGELFKLDAGTGELKYQLTTGASTVSVDPTTGHVFAVKGSFGSSEVAEYDASGAVEATLVSSFKPGSTVEGVAVRGSTEEVYISRSGTENVEVYGAAVVAPDVVTSPPSSNTGVRATLAGTVNPDGVELDECFFEWGEGSSSFDPYPQTTPCAESPATIGSGTAPVAVHADIDGLIPQGTNYHYRLVAVNPNGTINGSSQDFTTPDTVVTQAASGVAPTEATLNGTVNPDGTAITECVFEWGTEKGPFEEVQLYPEAAPCVPGPGTIGAGTSPVAVSAVLSDLHPGTRYAYRLKVANANGPILGDGANLQTTGPVVAAAWAEDVVYAEATLKAEIDPEGSATTYRFEYGTSDAYGSQTPELPVGSDSSTHEVTQLLDGLVPGTTYHYRVVASSGVAINEGPDLTFTTHEPFTAKPDCPNQEFRDGASARLPDCRAYEMASPVEKGGADVIGVTDVNFFRAAFEQSAASGEKITFSSGVSFGDQSSGINANQYLATREPGGWSTTGINAPIGKNLFFPAVSPFTALYPPYMGFDEELSKGWLVNETALTPTAMDGLLNLYERDLESGGITALTTGEPTTLGFFPGLELEFKGASADGSRAFFSAAAALTPDASPGGLRQIYESADGELHLVSVLPDGTADPDTSNVGTHGGVSQYRTGTIYRAISEDGKRVVWTSGGDSNGFISSAGGQIYVRENPTRPQSALAGGECTEPANACTIPVSESVTTDDSRFLTASTDGSEVVFRVEELGPFHHDLYRFDVETETPTLIAHDSYGVAGASEDLAYLYFASGEVLAPGATAGLPNLYLEREGEVEFIGSLPSAEVNGASAATQLKTGAAPVARTPIQTTSRVTPDGRHIVFHTAAPLGDYDNTDLETGEPAVEVYRYAADTQELLCISCNPSGARPDGAKRRQPFVTGIEPRSDGGGDEEPDTGAVAAAWIPTWEHPTYPSRVVSADGGRVFFNSFDALVPWDANGKQDVYQWAAQGTGGCTSPDGCLSLISSGESATASEFVDASSDGRDVFIRTKSSFDPRDDGLLDIYDARIGGGIPVPSSGVDCFGDACQDVPEPPGGDTPSSAVFRGAGDPRPRLGRDCGAQGRRAAKLSRRATALRRKAGRQKTSRKASALRKRSLRAARKAKRLSRKARRCRQANRRVGR